MLYEVITSQIEHERMNILVALGCFKEKASLQNALQYILDTVPARNKFVPVVAMASNPYAIPVITSYSIHYTKLHDFILTGRI